MSHHGVIAGAKVRCRTKVSHLGVDRITVLQAVQAAARLDCRVQVGRGQCEARQAECIGGVRLLSRDDTAPFGTFSIGRNGVARASALLCWIFWTSVHAARTDLPLLQADRPRPGSTRAPCTMQQSCLRHRPSPVAPGSATLCPAFPTTPAGAALGRCQVVGREFVAVSAPRRRHDIPPDTFPAEQGKD